MATTAHARHAARPLRRRVVGRALALASLVVAVAAVAPATASAWTAGIIGNEMQFKALAGEQNRLTITRVPNGQFTVTDPAGSGTPIGSGCQSQGSNTVVCQSAESAGVQKLTIELLEGNDSATASVPDPVEADGGLGGDTIASGSGNDTLEGGTLDAGHDTLSSGNGNDTVRGGAGHDTLDGGAGNDALHGQGEPDVMRGGDGNDSLDGGASDDTLDGGTGADVMLGADGRDLGSYETRTGAVEVTLGDALANEGQPGEGDRLEGVEDVRTGAGDDTIVGDGIANALDAGGGQDYVDGAAGPDAPSGGGDRDTIRSRDGVPEPVSCGPERDYAIVEPGDAVNPDCELFDLGVDNRPVLAQSAVVQPRAAVLRMLVRGTRRFVPLQDRINLPFGWRIDSAAGPVGVTAARGRRGRHSGTFNGGEFELLQARTRRPVTELRLSGGDFGACARPAASRTAHATRRRRVRRLFGNARGRFRTRGRRSSATVRGTRWIVEDRCDGTLTRVQRGVVDVRDFARRRTVRLRAGQRYLARAR